MAFSVSTLKGVKVYNLTFGKTAEQWKEEQRAGNIHSLRYNEAYRRRVEFIQDAVFPTSSLQVKMSADGMWMMATGLYPFKLKMFDLSELTIKFERGLESEPIDTCFLSENWEKFVVLRDHRWMEFHSRHGKHYNMRLPLIGTCMAYNQPMCELYTGTIKNIVLRANLEQGRYYSPFETGLEHISCIDMDRTHLLLACGDINGVVECWDPRQKRAIAKLDMFDSIPSISPTPEVTKLRFGTDGLSLAVGLGSGHVGVYDLRRSKPLHVLNHRNKIGIRDIHFHQQSSKIISSDAKTIRYWDQSSGQLYTVITPAEPINNLAVVENSGVIFVAQEQHRIGAYYVPSVGIAPKWCPFLDSMTEELEESKYKSIYVDYKFVSRDELEALGLEHLIGSNILKPYMHGYFMDIKLYRRVRSIVDPDAYDKFLKSKTEQQIAEQRTGRIKVASKLPNVNKAYANYLLQTKGEEQDTDLNPFVDPRFSSMFKDDDFKIDFSGDKYLHYHPEIKYAMDKAQYQHLMQHRNMDREEDAQKNGEQEEEDGSMQDGDDDDDILVDGAGDTYDDKFLQAKEHASVLVDGYTQQTALPTLLGSDDENDPVRNDDDDEKHESNDEDEAIDLDQYDVVTDDENAEDEEEDDDEEDGVMRRLDDNQQQENEN
eukprot:CAMPEP_0202687712 /NCGR_PEP_ID=MMETSP1385-20130828/3360_1 /ASSEMBLY_ACC=CAM_ASM_000861 /TAXON_ID=933848 /ORGANISM="Elphidium margaritaceum" /LENGTH=655 /DNA_ID=CAMNT_0049342551 /DNA_START=26 /DNA_END=1993 /DNA_ORIENTATION=+